LHPDEADMKNNGRFGFRILKNTEIDVWIVPIEHFKFYHISWSQFWPPDSSDIKNNGRFRFGIPKNTEIDILIISIENFEFHPLFGALF